ncbi:MAG: YggS family pyridoxal phosphate-dependent enzyme [Rikenellaceae bacterium]
MSVSSIIRELHEQLPQGVNLVAVSKYHPAEAILEAYSAGQRIFGESRVQELVVKEESLPKDIEWRMIGHLQSNKVKYIAPFISLIESVDSSRLLSEISRCAVKAGRCIDILFEIHVAAEQSKHGWDWEALKSFVESGELTHMPNIRVRGVMGMATYTDDMTIVTQEFNELKGYFEQLSSYFDESFDTLSMGMSDDYKIAIECGSTSVRIGSRIFGSR